MTDFLHGMSAINPLCLQPKLSLLTTCTFPTQASKCTPGILRSVSARPLGEHPPSSLQPTPRTRGRAPAGVTQTPRDLPGCQRQDEGAESHLPGVLYIHTIVPEQGGSPCPRPSSPSLHTGTFEAPVSSSRAAPRPLPGGIGTMCQVAGMTPANEKERGPGPTDEPPSRPDRQGLRGMPRRGHAYLPGHLIVVLRDSGDTRGSACRRAPGGASQRSSVTGKLSYGFTQRMCEVCLSSEEGSWCYSSLPHGPLTGKGGRAEPQDPHSHGTLRFRQPTRNMPRTTWQGLALPHLQSRPAFRACAVSTLPLQLPPPVRTRATWHSHAGVSSNCVGWGS